MKLKLRKIGNSQGVYIPKEAVEEYEIGDLVDIVITSSGKPGENVITSGKTPQNVITSKNKFCQKCGVWNCKKHGTDT